MKVLFKFLFFGFLISAGASNAAKRCKENHCKSYGTEINDLCGLYGKTAGDDVAIAPPEGGLCLCACSCVTEDTIILMHDFSTKRAKDIVEGDILYSPYTANNGGLVKRVIKSTTHEHPMILLTYSTGKDVFDIEVTPNHLFVGEDLLVREAINLDLGDKVLGLHGETYTIIRKETPNYAGNLINFIITNQDGGWAAKHIYVTNQLYSGDLLLQVKNDEEKILVPIGQYHISTAAQRSSK